MHIALACFVQPVERFALTRWQTVLYVLPVRQPFRRASMHIMNIVAVGADRRLTGYLIVVPKVLHCGTHVLRGRPITSLPCTTDRLHQSTCITGRRILLPRSVAVPPPQERERAARRYLIPHERKRAAERCRALPSAAERCRALPSAAASCRELPRAAASSASERG